MTTEELQAENAELRRQLAEAEEALAAIRSGQVDAIITDGATGPQVFSLAGTETVYRLAVETMAEAVLNVTPDGTILFCNARFSELVGAPQEHLLGRSIADFLPPEDRDGFHRVLAHCLREPVKRRVVFCTASGTLKPAHLSGCALTMGDEAGICLVAADLTELENSTQQIEQLRQAKAELRESRRTALNMMEETQEAREQAEQSAAALAVAHRQMQDLIDNTTANVYACDLEERFILVNAALAALLKTTPAQIIGKRRHEFMPQADADAHEAADREVIATGRAVEFEEHSDLHGRSITWLSTKFPLRDAQGRIYAVAGIVTDITERKQTEVELRTSEERLRLTLQASEVGTFEIDLTTGECQWNEVEYELLGLKPGATPASPDSFFSFVHPEDVAGLKAQWEEATRTGRLDAEFRVIRADGQHRWLAGKGQFAFANPADGGVVPGARQPLRFLGVNFDITARKESDAALRQSRLDLDRAQEVGQIGWWRLDTQKNVLTWSEQNYRIFGVAAGTPLSYESFLAIAHPDDRDYVHERWLAGLAGEPYDIEHRIVVAGRVKWVREKAYLEFGPDGGLLGGFGITQDVSDRKRAELALQESRDNLERVVAERTTELSDTVTVLESEVRDRILAEERLRLETSERIRALEALREKEQMLMQQNRQAAMGEMIGNIAHQWRQPLNTLGLFTQRIGVFYGTPSFSKEFLDTSIAKSMEIIQYMSQTIDDFRNFFSIERDKSEFSVEEAIDKALSLVEAGFKERRIVIRKEYNCGAMIYGFPNEYSQVLLNILINARDVFEERTIVDPQLLIITANIDGKSHVTIADNAGGIPDGIIGKIFDPYFTTKGPQQGTGVGLFMSKTIIENNMGGKLSVRNTGNGAEFRIEV